MQLLMSAKWERRRDLCIVFEGHEGEHKFFAVEVAGRKDLGLAMFTILRSVIDDPFWPTELREHARKILATIPTALDKPLVVTGEPVEGKSS